MPTDRKKHRLRFITVSALVGLLVFIGLMLSARFILPHLLVGKIRARLAARSDMHLAFQHLAVELLPRPALRLDRCTAVLRQNIRVSAAAVSIAPSMRALLGGRFEPLRVMVKGVVLQDPLPLAWPLAAKDDSPSGTSWRQIMAKIRNFAPHLVVIVRGGEGTFQGLSQAALLKISHLEATADLGAMQLIFNCRSNLWDQLQVRMDLDAERPGGRLQGSLEGIQVAGLAPWMPQTMGIQLVDGRGKLDVTADIHQGAADSLILAMDWPWLTVERRGRNQRLEKLAAHGRIEHQGGRWRLAVDSFTCARPALELSAADILINRREGAIPTGGADLKIKQASLDDFRTLVQALADDIPQANRVTEIVQGGIVRDVQLQSTALTPIPELARLENWHMAGHVDDLRLRVFDLPQPLDIQRGELKYAQRRMILRHADLQTGNNQLRSIDLALRWQGGLQLEGTVASAHVRAEDLRSLLARIPALSGHLAQAHAQGALNLQSFRITLPAQGAWQASAKGRADDVTFSSDDLPGSLTFADGAFVTTLGPSHTVVQIQNAHLNLLDASMDLTGEVRIAGGHLSHMGFTVSESHIGSQAVDWTWNALAWPARTRPQYAVAVNQGQVQWNGQDRFRVQTSLNFAGGPEIVLDIRKQGAGIEISRLSIKDQASKVDLAGGWHDRQYALRFSGRLAARTLAGMFPAFAQPSGGDLKGRFQISLDLDHPDAARLKGSLQIHEWTLPEFDGHDVALKAIAIAADGPQMTLSQGRLVLDGDPMDVNGQIVAGPQGLWADLNLQADALHWQKLWSLFEQSPQTTGTSSGRELAFGGKIHLTLNRFLVSGYTFTPLKATLTLVKGSLRLQVEEAELCNLALAGILETLPAGQLRIDLEPSAQGGSLMTVLQCLTKARTAIHGTFNLSSRLQAQGPPGSLVAALDGPVDFVATKGRIDKLPLLAKVLAFLNVTEIFAGRLPDLETEGLPYDKFTITGTITKGLLKIDSAHLTGPSVEIASYGTVNLSTNQLDLIVVVAPLKTVDRVIKKIPLVGTILGGNLLAVPVGVKGDWEDPRITPLAPGAVGDRLLKMFERTITLPGKLLLRPFTKKTPAETENPANGRPGGQSSP